MEVKTYNNIKISETTKKRRAQIKNQIDSFVDFQWRGCSAVDSFGAFIINDKKGSLKFYNGPSFSNEYSKPQFNNNGGDLMGVNFNKQTITFTIGVYWISAEHYRQLINWLDPLVVDYIIFDYEKHFRYNVKLSKLGDSTRWIVGSELVEETEYDDLGKKVVVHKSEPRYYTELSLSFEIQGEQCAKGVFSYEFTPLEYNEIDECYSTSIKTYTYKKDADGKEIYVNGERIKKHILDFVPSDLSTPIECMITLPITQEYVNERAVPRNTDENIIESVSLVASRFYTDDGQEKLEELTLFHVNLINLSYSQQGKNPALLRLQYNSETGLLFLGYGSDVSNKVLTLINTTDTGERIVESFSSNKFFIPGLFDSPDFYGSKEDFYEALDNFSLKLKWERKTKDNTAKIQNNNCTMFVECFPRTNLI